MISDLFGNNFREDPDAFRIFRELQVTLRTSLTFSVFTHLVKVNPMVLRHVKELQTALRHKLLNLDFWIRAGKRRTEAFGPKLYISPEMILNKAKARACRPTMPGEVLKFQQKERRNVEDADTIQRNQELDGLPWGSTEWKEMKLSKNNPHLM